MADWPLPTGGHWQTLNAATATSQAGTEVTSGANHANGIWYELTAATPRQAHALLISVSDLSTGNTSERLIDIGIGAAGSEVVLVADLFCAPSPGATLTGFFQFLLPIALPAGTRVAARCQAAVVGAQQRVGLAIYTGGWHADPPLGTVDTYGIDLTNSRGTPIDPGSTANTLGAWAELTAAVLRPARLVYLALGLQRNANLTTADYHINLGVGGAGSEAHLFGPVTFETHSTPDTAAPLVLGPFPVALNAGDRLVARAQSSTTDAADRLFDLVVYAIS